MMFFSNGVQPYELEVISIFQRRKLGTTEVMRKRETEKRMYLRAILKLELIKFY